MDEKKKKTKALLLYSGGLDSILAAKILARQGIEVTALTFVSYFFGAAQAEKSAEKNGLKLRVENISLEHFRITRKPKFGYGAGMNPCVDCHLLMLKTAKKIAREEKFDVIATGEVLGQRPMSQNIRALNLIEKQSNLERRVLRPLSAKVLPETEYEKSGLVNREKLLGISGRSRKEQLALAKKHKIKYFPTPAGGCILTDKEFSRKLRDLFENVKNPKPSDFALLRVGRHFWNGKTRIILGRNQEENMKLKKLAEKNDILIEPKDIPGPTALVRREKIEASIEASIETAKEKISKYAKSADKGLQLKISKGK